MFGRVYKIGQLIQLGFQAAALLRLARAAQCEVLITAEAGCFAGVSRDSTERRLLSLASPVGGDTVIAVSLD